MNTRSTITLRDRRRAAVQFAGRHVIYGALKLSSSYREMTDRDRVIIAIGRYAAGPLYGFSVDFEALLSHELATTYQLARCLRRQHRGSAGRGRRDQAATEYLSRLWKKAERYFSRPDVKSILDELVGDAYSNDTSIEADLSLLARWHQRRLRLPDFDGTVTRAAETDRKRAIDIIRRELAELTRESSSVNRRLTE